MTVDDVCAEKAALEEKLARAKAFRDGALERGAADEAEALSEFQEFFEQRLRAIEGEARRRQVSCTAPGP